MNIVRNCIDIVGITSKHELPKKIKGQIIETSETENLFIDDNIKIKNIYQIIIDANIKKIRVINTPINKIVVIDVIKKFKIAYYDIDNNMCVLELNTPYNIFFDLENDKVEIEKINIHIIDAYFELLENKMLYYNLLYIIDVHYLGDFNKDNKIGEPNYTVRDSMDNESDIIRKINMTDDILNHVVNELSIAEENNANIKKKNKDHENFKNEFIDIEDEYL